MASIAKIPQVLEDDVGNWTLASDCLLLDHLKDISISIQTRSKALIQQLERLDFDLSDMDVGLRNTFNDFLMLGNTQFIENRVYEDDSDGTDMNLAEPPDYSTNSIPVDIFATFKEAFLSGQKTLNKNDSAIGNQDPIKVDIYNTRPLPYIFGTQQFMQSLDAGLGGTIPNELSASHNAEMIESNMTGGDLEDIHNPNHQHRQTSNESSPRTGSLSSFSEERSADMMNSNTNSNSTIIAPASPHHSSRPGVPPSLPPPPPPSIPSMPSNSAPAAGRIHRHNSEGDSDDEDDTQSRPVIPPVKPSQWAPTVPASSSLVSQPMVVAVAPPPPPPLPSADSSRIPPPPPLPQSKPPVPPQEVEEEPDLFEADRDDPYSLFAPQRKTIKAKVNNSFADLFGAINNSDGYSASAKTEARSDSFSGIFNSSNDDALFKESGGSNAKTVPLETQAKSPASPPASSFSHTNTDDSYLDKKVNLPVAPPPVPPPVPPPPVPAPAPAPSKSTNDANKVSNKPSRFSSLFEDDDDDSSSLFSSSSSLPAGKASVPKMTSAASTSSSSAAAGRKKSIFEDDDNDAEDLFSSRPVSKAPSIPAVTPSSSSTVTADKKNKLKFLFDDGDDEGDAFVKPVVASTSAAVAAAPAVPPPPPPAAGPGSIAPPPQLPFPRPPIDDKDDDDDEDSEDDWGDGKSKPSVVRPPIPAPLPTKAPPPPQRKKTLFDDDDD